MWSMVITIEDRIGSYTDLSEDVIYMASGKCLGYLGKDVSIRKDEVELAKILILKCIAPLWSDSVWILP